MALWLIGIISILFGSMEQFLINESQIIAVVILLAGINCRDGYCINYCGSVEHQIG